MFIMLSLLTTVSARTESVEMITKPEIEAFVNATFDLCFKDCQAWADMFTADTNYCDNGPCVHTRDEIAQKCLPGLGQKYEIHNLEIIGNTESLPNTTNFNDVALKGLMTVWIPLLPGYPTLPLCFDQVITMKTVVMPSSNEERVLKISSWNAYYYPSPGVCKLH